MSSTYLLRCQHADAVAMIDVLQGLLDRYGGPGDAQPIALQLDKLTQLMGVHFTQEDYCLYPALIASSDREVAEAARSFRREIGELREQFEAFVRRWPTPEAIAAGFGQFKLEGSEIFSSIEDRCTRENELLFPLADALAARELGGATGHQPPLAA